MNRFLVMLREGIARLTGTLVPGRTDRDLEEELRSHMELADDEARHRDDGGTPGSARAVRIKAGGVTQAIEALRDQRGLPWLRDLARDLRHGLQLLRRNPAFTSAAVISLALGVGANTAVFSFADTLLLRPLPVPRAGDVLTVGSAELGGGGLAASYREYVDFRDRSTTLDLAAFTTVSAAFGTDEVTTPRLSIGMLVSGNLFGVMGVTPHLGRDFRPDEDQAPGRDAVVILGHEFWQSLGASPSILGQPVRLNGVPFTVIGVAPPGFTGLDQYTRFEFFAPLMMWRQLAPGATPDPLEDRSVRGLLIKGRLAHGATLALARAELSRLGRDLEQAYPDTNRNRVVGVRSELQNRMAQAPPIPVLLGIIGVLAAIVLLVACANVAGLLISRVPVRGREIALRMAIGAGRMRVVRQLVTESALIAAIGGLLGVAVGYAGVGIFQRTRLFATDLPISPVFALDQRALLVSLAAAAASALIFGVVPAFRATRSDLTSVMKTVESAAGGRRAWGRAALVVAQVAMSVVLLVVAAFFHRTFQQYMVSGPGFRLDHVLLMSINPDVLGYGEAHTHQFLEQLATRAREAPGVRSAALASYLPLDGRPPRIGMVPEGFEFTDGTEKAIVLSAGVGERYFETLSIPLVKGRGFLQTDDATAPRVAIVNELIASRYWPVQDAVGRRFRLNDALGPWVEIVGVAKNSKYSFITEPPYEFVYFPYRQRPPRPMTLIVHTAADPISLVTPLKAIIRTLDPNQPVYNVRTMEEFYQIRTVAMLTLLSSLIGVMGFMGLLLAIVGLYGLVAYAASRRTKEIGIRMAIGAGRAEVLRMVLRQGMTLALTGLGVGLLASAGANRAIGGVLRAVSGPGGGRQTDVAAYVLVAAVVLGVTLVAAYLPARRASRVNPTEALRWE